MTKAKKVCLKQIKNMIIFLFICCLAEGDLIADIFGKSDDEDEEFTGFGEDESTASKKKSFSAAVISDSDESDDNKTTDCKCYNVSYILVFSPRFHNANRRCCHHFSIAQCIISLLIQYIVRNSHNFYCLIN